MKKLKGKLVGFGSKDGKLTLHIDVKKCSVLPLDKDCEVTFK